MFHYCTWKDKDEYLRGKRLFEPKSQNKVKITSAKGNSVLIFENICVLLMSKIFNIIYVMNLFVRRSSLLREQHTEQPAEEHPAGGGLSQKVQTRAQVPDKHSLRFPFPILVQGGDRIKNTLHSLIVFIS